MTTMKDNDINHDANRPECIDPSDERSPLVGEDKSIEYKWKVYISIHITILFLSYGMAKSLLPSTFLDMLLITSSDVQSGSILFTASSAGNIIGSLISGAVSAKINSQIFLFVSAFAYGLFIIALPWANLLSLMAVLAGFQEVCLGALVTVANAEVFHLWNNSKVGAQFMQAINLGFTVGGVIAPIIAEPFIAPNTNDTEVANDEGLIEGHNFSEPFANVDNEETNVYFAYLIVGVSALVTSFMFLYNFFKLKVLDSQDTCNTTRSSAKERDKLAQTSRVHKFLLLALAVPFTGISVCLQASFMQFLMTYVVKDLNWTKSSGTQINALYWGCMTGGRIVSVIISRHLSAGAMITVDLTVVLLSYIAMALWSETSDIAMWVCVAFLSLALSGLFPSGMTWVHEQVLDVTGAVAGAQNIAIGLALMGNASLIGVLFDSLSPIWFIYLLIIEAVITILLFTIITMLVRRGYGKYLPIY